MADWKPRAAVVAGALCLLGWATLIAGLFAGVEAFSAGQAPALVLFGLVTLAAASTLFVRNAWTIVGFVAAILYGTVFVYFRNGFDKMMPDALFYALVGIFYIAPLVTGAAALIAGMRGVRAARS